MVLAVAAGVFLVLRRHFETARWWRPALAALLLCWVAVILFGTLGSRATGSEHASPSLIPLASYYAVLTGKNPELLRSNFMNAALFFPAGLLAIGLFPRRLGRGRRLLLAVAMLALLSASIECGQYLFHLGLTEADDLLHNTLGAAVGAGIGILKPTAPPNKSRESSL